MAGPLTPSPLVDGAKPAVRVVRLQAPDADALRLIEEYYEAVHVVLRDDPETVRQIVEGPGSGLWVACLQDQAVGCVMLRELESLPDAGECKRLYVQPQARGHGIADALMDALESFARDKGQRWIYLDTYHSLKPAIALYTKRGYVECERYNDNPQATCFFRKNIGE
ncbi:MAG TPA: GNAT family N-acetyltransferase [Gammaproteobacteria bacterium]|nr:GNAT family N-acetyltransferase [Gammaproteobacteria bacterium]